MRIKGKVAVITGAGTGIGAASARLFANEGGKVVVAEINEKNGQAVVDGSKNGGSLRNHRYSL